MSDEVKINETENTLAETSVSAETETAEEAQRPITDNDEIKAFHKEVLGKLDSPLVVHKKDDASYEDDAAAFDMEMTHNEEAKPTLERHRFKKEPGSKGNGIVTVLILLMIAATVFAGLYFTGSLPFQKEKETVTESQTEEPTTTLQEKYAGTIVVKNTYIFVDGVEVDGIAGLQNELKYLDASTTAYVIINEHADSDFLNYNVYPILTDLGFFGDDTVVEVREKTGLMSADEIAEQEESSRAAEAATATTASTTAPSTTAASTAAAPTSAAAN